MSQLSLKNLEKSFGEAHIIKGIDLEVSEGEFVVFVGPSGCGKSTLLRMIAGLEEVSDGEIVIAGIPGEEATVKTFLRKGGKVVLRPANERLADMEFDPDDVSIYGRVVSVLRRL